MSSLSSIFTSVWPCNGASAWSLTCNLDLGLLQVGFVLDTVTLVQVFSEYFGFPLSLSFHQCFILIYSCLTEQLTSSCNNAHKNNFSDCWGNMADDQILTVIVFSVQFPYRLSYCSRAAIFMEEYFFLTMKSLCQHFCYPSECCWRLRFWSRL